jgi:hypothetical protein
MTYTREESSDVAKVVEALGNGLRSELEIAKTARLTLERVQLCISFLMAHGCVVEAALLRFRLTDNGNDMLKRANAAKLQRQALRVAGRAGVGR